MSAVGADEQIRMERQTSCPHSLGCAEADPYRNNVSAGMQALRVRFSAPNPACSYKGAPMYHWLPNTSFTPARRSPSS